MVQILIEQELDYSNPIVFSLGNRYSTGAAVQILEELELKENCEILDKTGKSSGYGKLIEHGIKVRIETIEISIKCSYEDLFIYRVSGNKRKFYSFCESIRTMDFDHDRLY